MTFRAYEKVDNEERFIASFTLSLDTAIFIRAYYAQYPDSSVYVRTNGHMRHIDHETSLEVINTHLIELTAGKR
jgi:hypothetical protein